MPNTTDASDRLNPDEAASSLAREDRDSNYRIVDSWTEEFDGPGEGSVHEPEDATLGLVMPNSEGPFRLRAELRFPGDSEWKPASVLWDTGTESWWTTPWSCERDYTLDEIGVREPPFNVSRSTIEESHPIAQAQDHVSEDVPEDERYVPYGDSYALQPVPDCFRIVVLNAEEPVNVEIILIGEGEQQAPAPRPETEEMDPDPFQGDPAMTSFLADTFSTTTERVLREAEGEPAPTHEGEWGEDSTGHPIRVEQLGNPYEGRATFKVQARGEPDPTAVEASMGWKMLDRMDMDTVWLHLLLLGYASATHRRGDRPVIRIPRRTVEKVFGYRNDNYTMDQRAKKIRRHVEALQSIFVQFQNVRRHGDKLHFRGDMTSGAPLWGLRMVAKGQQDLFTGETVADWHLEAREGMWAEEFLHNHGDQWAPLPKEWFEQIDRRGSRNFAQRLAVYLLFQFRINAENSNRAVKSAQTLLEVCGEDMTRSRSSRRRSELKRCLSNALDTLERDYGIQVHAGRVHMDETKGMDFDRWKKRAAAFDPPPSMDGRLFQNAEGEAPPLPDVAGDWKPNQIRHLRTEVLDETQPELGKRLDVSKQYVSQLERGTSEPSTRVRTILDRLQARHE